ncbi:hypothetical protein AJ79_06724 [Helicocarpus griseus UAMH5409]|uniref:Uncharacterized protein n=1 Tax=Helicocarpus griseus UAMH5409 TaxID=1447875 RepID=A0A2B7XAN5_9EURO|nr:hypothetical protein AJ79_06724 [Helicocarpus griseus UAMH5409]
MDGTIEMAYIEGTPLANILKVPQGRRPACFESTGKGTRLEKSLQRDGQASPRTIEAQIPQDWHPD